MIFNHKYNISVTPSPLLIYLKNRGGCKFWKKYNLQEIFIDGNHLGKKQI